MTERESKMEVGPSGRGYRVWANGNGVEVWDLSGVRIHDAGSHVPVVPLVDCEFVAALLAKIPESAR